MMTREDLIASARALSAPSLAATEEFSRQRDALAARVNQAMAQRSDLEKLVGPGGRAMSEDNNRNFPLFMESLFQVFEPEVLVDTVLWVFRTYRAHGFRPIYWPANLDTWVEILRQELPADAFAAVFPFYRWLITRVPAFTALTDEALGQ
jgi:hypothetical protein